MIVKLINNRTYFYESVREGRRVRSRYLGPGGPADDTLVRLVERERARRDSRRRRLAAERREWRAMAEWFDGIERLARAVLEAAGYRRHKRGEWRKPRMGTAIEKATEGIPKGGLTPAELQALTDRAHKGDAAAMPNLRRILKAEADGVGYCGFLDCYGAPPHWLREKWAEAAAGENLLVKEAVPLKIAQVARELAGPDPSPIEKILAERAAFCWYAVYNSERRFEAQGRMDIAQADCWQRRIDAEHKRFLTACRTLATVRRLAVPPPAVQVNVGKTVNAVQNA